MKGRTRFILSIFAATLIGTFSARAIIAQSPAPSSTWSQDDALRVIKEVQTRLRRVDNSGVFDWITFGIQGKTVVVRGYASLPILKKNIDAALKGIPGVESVDNQIEVLPASMNDDRIRAAVYTRIYTAPSLRKYNASQGSARQAIGPGNNIALKAGGITNSPPMGFHAIHIIVKNGNVTLYGVVNNEMDSDVANVKANTAPGAFSVENNLDIAGSAPKTATAK